MSFCGAITTQNFRVFNLNVCRETTKLLSVSVVYSTHASKKTFKDEEAWKNEYTRLRIVIVIVS